MISKTSMRLLMLFSFLLLIFAVEQILGAQVRSRGVIKKISIQSALSVSSAQAAQAGGIILGKTVYTRSLARRLKRSLEQSPRVSAVRVSFVDPHNLIVEIEKKEAVALITTSSDKSFLVDSSGLISGEEGAGKGLVLLSVPGATLSPGVSLLSTFPGKSALLSSLLYLHQNDASLYSDLSEIVLRSGSQGYDLYLQSSPLVFRLSGAVTREKVKKALLVARSGVASGGAQSVDMRSAQIVVSKAGRA